MNTPEKLNKIVAYIENNLDKGSDINVLAVKTAMSSYDLQRMFAFICEMSI